MTDYTGVGAEYGLVPQELPVRQVSDSSSALARVAAFNCQHLPVQDVILMSDSCDLCGYKNSELKGGGGVSDFGRRITLHVSEPDDLQRDVIKAETASVRP